MRFRRRSDDDHDRRKQGPASPDRTDRDRLEGLRAAGEEFLAAGAEAIDRVLSGDSEAFLAANRQQGGE